MTFLPGFDKRKDQLTPQQYRAYYTTHVFLNLLFVALIILVLLNVYRILIKMGKWRNMPLLFFYIFTFIQVVSREVYAFFGAMKTRALYPFPYQSSIAKISVGLVQLWIILELAIRIR